MSADDGYMLDQLIRRVDQLQVDQQRNKLDMESLWLDYVRLRSSMLGDDDYGYEGLMQRLTRIETDMADARAAQRQHQQQLVQLGRFLFLAALLIGALVVLIIVLLL
jgi:hypothetical protein